VAAGPKRYSPHQLAFPGACVSLSNRGPTPAWFSRGALLITGWQTVICRVGCRCAKLQGYGVCTQILLLFKMEDGEIRMSEWCTICNLRVAD
jgi:hypothetical protein